MTDHHADQPGQNAPSTASAPAFLDYLEAERGKTAAAQAAITAVKAVLVPVLQEHGIASVNVAFDGYSDEGQIEGVRAYDANNHECALPDLELTIFWPAITVQYGAPQGDCAVGPVTGYVIADQPITGSLGDVLREVSMALLSLEHGSWETGEGAYGDIKFDVRGDLITLDFYERYVDTKYACWEW